MSAVGFRQLHRRPASAGPDLLLAATRAIAGRSAGPGWAVLARFTRRGRALEVVCVGGGDVVSALAPLAAIARAELVVEYAGSAGDPCVAAAVRRGSVLLGGSLPEAHSAVVAGPRRPPHSGRAARPV